MRTVNRPTLLRAILLRLNACLVKSAPSPWLGSGAGDRASTPSLSKYTAEPLIRRSSRNCCSATACNQRKSAFGWVFVNAFKVASSTSKPMAMVTAHPCHPAWSCSRSLQFEFAVAAPARREYNAHRTTQQTVEDHIAT